MSYSNPYEREIEAGYTEQRGSPGQGLPSPLSDPARRAPESYNKRAMRSTATGRETHTYTQTNAVNVSLITTTVSQQLVPANPDRNYLIIQNRGVASVYISVDSIADPLTSIELIGGGVYEPISAPVNSINIVSTVAGQLVTAIDGVL